MLIGFHSLYLLFPMCAPVEGSDELKMVQAELSSVSAGEGRALAMQAIMQLVALGVTMIIAIFMVLTTGLIK